MPSSRAGKGAGSDLNQFVSALRSGQIGGAIITGNYPSDWGTPELLNACRGTGAAKPFVVLLDTLTSPLADAADTVLPCCTWLEKAGTFENARNMLQAFEAAIPPIEPSKSEGQIALDLLAMLAGSTTIVEPETIVVSPGKAGQVPDSVRVMSALGEVYNAAHVRAEMVRHGQLGTFATDVSMPALPVEQQPDMQMVEL